MCSIREVVIASGQLKFCLLIWELTWKLTPRVCSLVEIQLHTCGLCVFWSLFYIHKGSTERILF